MRTRWAESVMDLVIAGLKGQEIICSACRCMDARGKLYFEYTPTSIYLHHENSADVQALAYVDLLNPDDPFDNEWTANVSDPDDPDETEEFLSNILIIEEV